MQVNKLLADFVVLKGEAWRGATADAPDQGQQLLADALQKYQVRCTSCDSVASWRWGSRGWCVGGARQVGRCVATTCQAAVF